MTQESRASTRSLADQLRPVLLRLARELRREAQSLGITGGQVALLAQIRKSPGITASELADRERMSAPGMSGHIGRLESAGLIERTRAADRRRMHELADERLNCEDRQRRCCGGGNGQIVIEAERQRLDERGDQYGCRDRAQ